MKASAILVCFIVFVTLHNWIEATHFEGDMITYKVLNTSESIVSILLIQTYIYDFTKM